MKANIKVLKDVFKAYSGRFSQITDKVKYMSNPEFVSIIEKLNILSD